jgi:hypothetical protein
MRTSHPPAAATWLLENLCSGQKNESLTGDLIEEFQRGRSRLWYWWQVLAAIFVSFYREVSSHNLLAVSAIATGWTIWLSYQSVCRPLLNEVFLPWITKAPLIFGRGTPEGFAWWTIWLSVRAISGWTIAKLYRAHAIGMVLVFSVSVLIWKLQDFPWTCHLVLEADSDARYFLALIAGLMSMFLPSIFIVLGGLLAARPDQSLAANPDQNH